MASSSSLDPSKRQFDVFVSFRGKDTRKSFTSHLLGSLKRKNIDAFSDAQLPPGYNLSILFERIEQSKISIVVFSEHYADSTWCLEEIWKIIECTKKRNHKVIPIFYNVKTSDVGEQKESFGAPFLTPEESFKEDCHKVEAWKEALKVASDIVGFVLPGDRTESEVVEKIANDTLKILNKLAPCDIPVGFPGLESRSEELEELLRFGDANCVRTIGVLGMTGIGKTTVADIVYKRNLGKFDGYCSLGDIGNVSKQYGGLQHLREKLLCKLLDMENVDVGDHVRLIINKKVLIVLDNVTEVKQITTLLGDGSFNELYRKGSRIVITTRDRKLLSKNIDETYVVPRLNDSEAMELFCLKAFSDTQLYPPEEFVDLSTKFLSYSKGHPLALRVLGLALLGKDETYWKNEWEMLMEKPHKEIQIELKTSYEGLEPEQQIIFLDIACFFKSEKVDFVLSILKLHRVNAAAVMTLIRDLEDKCLLIISDDRLEMHDLMHIMGKEIECESSIEFISRRSRLWNYKDIRPILEKKKGTEYVRGIFLNMSNVAKIKLSPAAFMTMSNLKFLKFHNSHCSQWCENDHKFQSCKGVDQFPDELVYLHWQGYPYDYLPSGFDPEKLVDLNMRYSHIKQLWGDEMITENLRWVDLSQSKHLLNLSGLSNAINLESLDLEGCTSLAALGPSLEQMNKLIYLNLRDCTSLESLPHGINLKSLKTLNLTGCSNLHEFHIISENIEFLYLEGSAIKRIVVQIESLRNLILLNLKDCRKLRYLPNDYYKLKSLQELILSGCSALESLPHIKDEMICLEILLMDT